jgi:ParB-like chromosome segregation protein Spo0J
MPETLGITRNVPVEPVAGGLDIPYYLPHEYCLIPDALDASEMAKLESSMRAVGFLAECPIILYEGKILDGWHRYQASRIVGVMPHFSVFTGTKEQALDVAYFSLFGRRHVPQGRKAAVAVLYDKKRREAGEDGMTHEALASMAGVSKPYISQAASVANRDPNAIPRVITGEMSLARAYKDLARSEPEKGQSQDPLFDVWTTRDKWKLVVARLQEIADRDVSPLSSRRGSESIIESYTTNSGRGGEANLGKTALGALIGRIKANMPHCPCEQCEGRGEEAGCQVCGGLGWWTVAQARSRTKVESNGRSRN